MGAFSGVNLFGSLTFRATGQQVSWYDLSAYDADGNGEIDKNEFKQAKEELGLDDVSFLSKADENKNFTVSEDEFKLWEQEQLMQNALNVELEDIYNDEILSNYYSQIKKELTTFMNDYISTHKSDEDISIMAENFTTELKEKAENLKESTKNNDPVYVKNGVLDELYNTLNTEFKDALTQEKFTQEDMNLLNFVEVMQSLFQNIEILADAFMKSYKGDNLKVDLKNYLEDYVNKSDSARAKSLIDTYNDKVKDYGDYMSNNDFKSLKNAVKELLQGILDSGVVSIKVGGINVASSSAITSALAQYTDAASLKKAVDEAIKSLSTTTKKDEFINKAKLIVAQKKEEKFTNITGDQYRINPGVIDYSTIPGYYTNDEICEVKGQHWDGAKDEAVQWLRDNLQEKLWTQIKEMLKSQGLNETKDKDKFDQVKRVSDNTFNSSAIDAANACVDGHGGNLFHKSRSWTYSKNLTDKCIELFNQRIAANIEAIKNPQNFTTIDLNFESLNQTATYDESGNVSYADITGPDGEDVKGLDDGQTLIDAYRNGTILTVKHEGSDYYVTVAQQMIDGLKPQMLNKAKATCKANGVEFDMTVFTSMFNNAKSLAVAESITGNGHERWIHAGNQAGQGAIGGLGVGAAAGCFLGPVGIVGGAVIGTVVGAIGGFLSGLCGASSKCSFDVRKCVDTFTQNFKTNYETWVNGEKSKQV